MTHEQNFGFRVSQYRDYCKDQGISYSILSYRLPFFGVNTGVAGVAYNLSKALKSLGDQVRLISMTGSDVGGEYVRREIETIGIDAANMQQQLRQTPNSVILYDGEGKRQIYCDLKDIQDMSFDFQREMYQDCDVIVACNINFNRNLLKKAKAEIFASYKIGFDGAANGFADEQKIEELAAEIVF